MTQPDAPPPRQGAGRRLIAVVIAAVLVGAAVSMVVLADERPQVSGLDPAGPSPFGTSGELAAGPSRAWYSPDGSRLAVLTAGAVALAIQGEVRPITAMGGNVVDAAWFSAGTALLVAEGPVPTGGLAVIEVSGEVRGTIPLDPVLAFGEGLGMSIAPGGKRAVVTAVERDPLGATRTHLATVDLVTGRTAMLDTGPGQARAPHHVDASRIAFTRVVDSETEAVVLDVLSGELVVLGDGDVRGVIGAGEAVAIQVGDRLVSRPPAGGDAGALASSLAAPVVAVHPSGLHAVVAPVRGDAVVLSSISLVGAGST